ncbi:MAG: hypothetical protein LUD77_02105, partial [Clostridiales bacterium]|nr:hypothetical protein [Clostridiales bacterium]
IIVILLLIIIVVSVVVQICLNKTQTVSAPVKKAADLLDEREKTDETEGGGLKIITVTPKEEPEEKPDLYDTAAYIFQNSKDYMERLKTEVNNMANSTSDNEHLYDVAESIRLNQISYYTTLSGYYDSGSEELVKSCKSYVFNVEALAANIMEYIKDDKTKYISRAMICISNDTTLSSSFTSAAETYKASLPAEPETETGSSETTVQTEGESS